VLSIIAGAILTAIAGYIAVLVADRSRARPNRDRRDVARVRMPKLIAIVGWLFVGAGVPLLLVAWAVGPRHESEVGMSLTALGVLLGGLFFLAIYRNWYVAFGEEEVRYRTVLGVSRSFRYSDIVECTVKETDQGPVLRVRAVHGQRLTLNVKMYDASPLLAQVQFRQATGRWPVRGELRAG
jgi:hypothetical protein